MCYRMTHTRNCGSIAGTDKRVISSPIRADRPWGWHPFTVEVKNKDSPTSIPKYIFISCTTTTLGLACRGQWCFGPRHMKATRNSLPWLRMPQNISAGKKSKTRFSCLGNLSIWTTWKQKLKFFKYSSLQLFIYLFFYLIPFNVPICPETFSNLCVNSVNDM